MKQTGAVLQVYHSVTGYFHQKIDFYCLKFTYSSDVSDVSYFSIGRLLLLTYISDVIGMGRGEVFVLGLMSSNLVRSVVSCRVSMHAR